METPQFGSLLTQGRGDPLPRTKRPSGEDALRVLRVMIADDDDEYREMVSEVLAEENGWEMLHARDGTEALQIALSERPEALILDQRMPGLLGTEVVLRLRSEGVSLPVVLISGSREARELAESIGVEHFLSKPFGYDQLAAMVSAAIAAAKE